MKKVFMISLLSFLFPLALFANSPFKGVQNTNAFLPKIKISVLTDKTSVLPGEEFMFFVSLLIEEGWHIYSLYPVKGSESLATQIVIDEGVFQKQGTWKEPKPILIEDGAVGKMVKGHKGNVEFTKSFTVPIGVAAESYFIKGKLIFRACDNQICTLPQEYPFKTAVRISRN